MTAFALFLWSPFTKLPKLAGNPSLVTHEPYMSCHWQRKRPQVPTQMPAPSTPLGCASQDPCVSATTWQWPHFADVGSVEWSCWDLPGPYPKRGPTRDPWAGGQKHLRKNANLWGFCKILRPLCFMKGVDDWWFWKLLLSYQNPVLDLCECDLFIPIFCVLLQGFTLSKHNGLHISLKWCLVHLQITAQNTSSKAAYKIRMELPREFKLPSTFKFQNLWSGSRSSSVSGASVSVLKALIFSPSRAQATSNSRFRASRLCSGPIFFRSKV